ncbi:hypothetical protein WJ968_04950 [Achromobacter xylosoxidans]
MAPPQRRHVLDDVPDDLLLLARGHLVHLDDERHAPAQVRHDLPNTEHREVAVAREVLGENALQFGIEQCQGGFNLAANPVLDE